MKQRILIVDDDDGFCQTVSDILSDLGYEPTYKTNPVEALEHLEVHGADLILLDIQMPQMDGREALSRIVERWPHIPVIVITGQAYNVPVAIEVSKKGSYNFLGKPIDIVQLTEYVTQALGSSNGSKVTDQIETVMRETGFVSVSSQIIDLLSRAERAAQTTVPILITGESGVGKEMMARAIHRMSPRRDAPFVAVDCGVLAETLLEAELFGHVKGSFTGADRDKDGFFTIANHGTIFLDEITNTTPQFQQKLLQVLNSSRFRRVGGISEIEADVRVISATNKNLRECIAQKTFREDLYYRLNGYATHLPPLRERREDIPVLAKHLLTRAIIDHRLQQHYFSPAALELLQRQEWHGNVRELASVVTKLGIFAEAEEIPVSTVAHALRAEHQDDQVYEPDNRPLMEQVEEFEKRLILEALRDNGGNQTRAAEQLGLERTNLIKKMRKHGLTKDNISNNF
jgi:two-component system NtrC family response regulator